jgi:creatinine amidohydrolase
MQRHLKKINHLELKDLVPREVDRVIVPVGTIEAHGVIPLGTDIIIPEVMAERIAPEINAIIAPSVTYGITRGLVGHPGTVSIRPAIFEGYVSDLLESLARTGFRKIVVLNGHGGQIEELKDALFEVSRECEVKTLLINWWYDTDEVRRQTLGREGGHAGADETACIVAIDTSLVKPDLFDDKMSMMYSSTFTAYPFPGSMIRYTEGDWSLNLDETQCKAYFDAVTSKVSRLIREVMDRWEAA